MAVEIAFAEAGKMFATSEDAASTKSGEELPRVRSCFPGIGGDGTRTHHFARGFEGEVEDGGEIDIESKEATVFPNDLTMLTKELAIGGGEYLRGRRRWPKDVPESVDASAFEINTEKER